MQSCRFGTSCRSAQHVGGATLCGRYKMRPSKALGTLGKVVPVIMLLLTFCASHPTQAIARHKPPTCIEYPTL